MLIMIFVESERRESKLGKEYIINLLFWIENGKSFSITTDLGHPLTNEGLIPFALLAVKNHDSNAKNAIT